MRILIADVESQGLGLALRAVEAGHEVRLARWSRTPIRDGDGFSSISIVDDWRPSMAWVKGGLVITTGNARWMTEMDRFRDFGFDIFGPTARSAELEINRQAGMEAMQAVGIEVPAYQSCNSLEEAEKLARKSPDPMVFKTLGSEDDKSLTYVADDPADMVGWLGRQIARGMRLKGPCMLQAKIDMVAEIGVSGWFGPEGFLPDKWQTCFEHKKLMAGDNGPNTGEMGTVCQYVETDKLADEMLVPMAPILRTAGHRGDFAVGAGIDSKGRCWPFEFTARLGWPAFPIQLASHRGDPVLWMKDLMLGKDTLRVRTDVAIGVVLAQPRFPYGGAPTEAVEGNPIRGLEGAWPDVYPFAVMAGKGPMMRDGEVVAGTICQTSGECVAVATGLGRTVEQARRRVYDTVDQVRFANRMFRTDIGEKLADQLPFLHEHGYATQMRFS